MRKHRDDDLTIQKVDDHQREDDCENAPRGATQGVIVHVLVFDRMKKEYASRDSVRPSNVVFRFATDETARGARERPDSLRPTTGVVPDLLLTVVAAVSVLTVIPYEIWRRPKATKA
jgi:hypothetical protein